MWAISSDSQTGRIGQSCILNSQRSDSGNDQHFRLEQQDAVDTTLDDGELLDGDENDRDGEYTVYINLLPVKLLINE